MRSISSPPTSTATPRRPGLPLDRLAPLVFLPVLLTPLLGDDYITLIATRAAIYWVLVSGLNLVVGFAGRLAIGYVSLLTVGAYTASILVERTGIDVFLALAAAGVVGAICGAIVGLPSLRLRTFYFAMTTFGFATIVTQIALGWTSLTGGGIGIPGPMMPGVLGSPAGFLCFCVALALLCTWMTTNVALSHTGRALIALRDAEVAAEASGISKPGLLMTVFIFSGVLAAISGGLFASLQTYVSPDAFTFDLSLLFFIGILFGGQGSVLGPLLGTILLTILPEISAPLAAWSTFLYAALLLAIVLLIPGGIADLLDFRSRRALATGRVIVPQPELLPPLLQRPAEASGIALRGTKLRFGSVVAINDLDFDLRPGEVHGLIGPNGSGKTTTLNVICGFAHPQEGSVTVAGHPLTGQEPHVRVRNGITRTFQTPRVVGAISVLDNVLIGGIERRRSFVSTLLSLPSQRRRERALRARAHLALRVVGLDDLAHVRAERLQHSELRFLEIARALMAEPAFVLLDEPAAGLAPDEIRQLAALVKAMAANGVGVLVVEHHADLIFNICDRVTVLDFGQVLADGAPEDIRANKEVMSAYLGT